MVFGFSLAQRAFADALVTTQAMQADTIVGIFIEDDEIRFDYEIGGSDIEAFQNLLPSEILQKLTGSERPLLARERDFLEMDLLVEADGQVLDGVVSDRALGLRVVRDEITGQPLAVQPSDAEIVLRVRVTYPLHSRVKEIVVRIAESGSRLLDANLGFIAFHMGVPVNDFRYLPSVVKLSLDWDDPWYTAFERNALRRRFYAPAAAFLYVENFEVRKEIVFRPKDLQSWVDLGLEGRSTIEVDQREEVCRRAAEFLAEHTPLEIDSKRLEGTLDRVDFIQRSLRTTGVVPPDESISIDEAIIGAIYVYRRTELPQYVEMQWDLFNDRIDRVPTMATDEAGGMPGTLSVEEPVMSWRNFLKNPTVPAFADVATPTPAKTLSVSPITLVCLGLFAVVLFRAGETGSSSRQFVRGGSMLALLVIAAGAAFWPVGQMVFPLGKPPQVSNEEASEITFSLLNNVYRAFDYRDESTVYDVLDRSVNGELLTQIYLDTRESLTLASQGGARVKVNDVQMIQCDSSPAPDDAFVATCKWVVSGAVGHWGHLHQRMNEYTGEFTVRAIDGQWKLTKMNVLSEERQQ